MSHFCPFCQVEHSSASCYHPGHVQLVEMRTRAEKAEAEVEALTKARDRHIGAVAGMRHLADAMQERAERAEERAAMFCDMAEQQGKRAETAEAALAAARAEAEALRQDAERYRRLRSEKGSRVRICTFASGPAFVLTGEQADAAIDAALAAKAGP